MKLLVSDLDGTFYPKKEVKNSQQFQENIEAVKKWIENGNKFAVATARGLHHYSVLTEKLGFEIDFIGGNGATVLLDTGERIIKQFSSSVFIDLCQFIRENEINAGVATGIGEKWLWSSDDCYPRGVEAYQSIWEFVTVADLTMIDPSCKIERIQIFTPSENRDALKALILEKNYPVIVTTSDHDMIDIGPLDSSKGISIMELCKKYGIDLTDVIVVGDSENDIAMFEIVESSYCINHAESAVLEKASRIVESVKEVIDIELGDTR